jgi:hypothetical protein
MIAAGRRSKRTRTRSAISDSSISCVPKVPTSTETGYATPIACATCTSHRVRWLRRDDVLGNRPRRIRRRPIDLGRIVPGKRPAAMPGSRHTYRRGYTWRSALTIQRSTRSCRKSRHRSRRRSALKKNAARPRSRAQAPTKRTIKPSLYCPGKIGPSVADHGRGTRPINRPDLGFATGFGSASSRRPTTARRAFTRWYAAAEHSAQVSNAGRAVRKQQTTHFP